jgi:anti-sigma B factor antagonist
MHTSYEALVGDTVVIGIEGEIDAFTAPALKEQLYACLDSGFGRLVLEMSECCSIDSVGLGVLVDVAKHAGGREVAIAAPGPELRHILEVVGLDHVLPLYRSRSEALQVD